MSSMESLDRLRAELHGNVNPSAYDRLDNLAQLVGIEHAELMAKAMKWVRKEKVEPLEAENERLRSESAFFSRQVLENGERNDRAIDQMNAENAKLRDALKALMMGTNVELCADRDASQCQECSMALDEYRCVMSDAILLLGIDMYGEPLGAEVSE